MRSGAGSSVHLVRRTLTEYQRDYNERGAPRGARENSTQINLIEMRQAGLQTDVSERRELNVESSL